MKNFKKLFGLCLVVGSLLLGGFLVRSQVVTNTNNIPLVKTVFYTEVNTNWDFVTNHTSATWEWNSGGPSGVNTMDFTNDYPSSYVGVITSNKFLNVYYDNKLITNKLLETKKIGEISITWEQITIFHTNVVSYP